MLKKYYLFIALLYFMMNGPSIAQVYDFELYRKAITELNTEYQAKKNDYLARYEISKEKTAKYFTGGKPSVTVLGGTPEENELMAIKIEEAIDDIPPPTTNEIDLSNIQMAPEDTKPVKSPDVKSTPSSKTAQDKPTTVESGNNEPITFTSEPMFPDEPQGTRLYKKGTNPKDTIPIKWEMSEVYTTIDTFETKDIKDPVERKKWEEIDEHVENIYQLNKIGLINAMYVQSTDQAEFLETMEYLKNEGYSLEGVFAEVKKLDEKGKLEFMKSAIVKQAEEILNK